VTQRPPESDEWRRLRQSIGRLFLHGAYCFAAIGLHWAGELGVKWTHQEGELWARVLLAITSWYAVSGFAIVAGAEVVVDCWEAVRDAWRRIRGG
jgi:hypothetical protein